MHRSKSRRLLQLLSLTMVSSKMLVKGGFYYESANQPRSNIRNAEKALRNLCVKRLVGIKRYGDGISYRNYYFLKGKDHCYHKITPGLVSHESLISLFLVHMFQNYTCRGYLLKWHNPIDIGIKKCDGAVSLLRKGNRRWLFILEADQGNHDDLEIKEKFFWYRQCLASYENCQIYFLSHTPDNKTYLANSWQHFLSTNKERSYDQRMKFICPESLSPST